MQRLLSLVLLTLLSIGAAAAQDDVAISARVVYPGVTMQLVGTQDALPLREGSVFPLRAGDTLRTDRQGRVWLSLPEALELLLLPNSELTVVQSDIADNRLVVRLALRGQSIQLWRQGIVRRGTFQIETGDALTTVEWTDNYDIVYSLFGLWSEIEGSTVATVAFGELSVESDGKTDTLYSSEGWRNGIVTPMEGDLNAARLIGFTEGCEGRVRTALDALNIRAGTSLGYAIIGYVNDGQPITLLGRTEDGNWYRVQRYSGFGWMLASAIDTDCVPPTYPNQYGEDNVEFFAIESIELDLLAPFFGTPETNLWFFRSFAAE